MAYSSLLDSWEDGDDNGWSNVANVMSVDSSRAYNGSNSYHASAGNSYTGYALAERGFGGAITDFEVWYNETTNSQGHGYQLLDASGNRVLGVGSGNPQFIATDGSTGNGVEVDAGSGYDDWVRIRVNIDYSGGTYDVEFYNSNDNYTRTGTFNLDTNNPVEQIRLVNVNKQDALQQQVTHTGQNDSGLDVWTDYITYTPDVTQPSLPNNVSLSYVADDQIRIDWDEVSDWGGETGSYNLEISRDGSSYVAPSGGETSMGGGLTSYFTQYTPNSDNSYESQIGIDSAFQMRIQAQNSAGTSSWVESNTVYTTPIPPHNPSVSRPDGYGIGLSWEKKSQARNSSVIEYREDSGSGYGPWYSPPDNYAIETNRSGDRVLVGDIPQDLSGDLTICMRVRPDDLGTARENIIDKSYGGEFSFTWEDGSSKGTLHSYCGSGGVDTSPYAQNEWQNIGVNGEWIDLVWVRDNSAQTIKLYVDGVEQPKTNSEWNSVVQTSEPIEIGTGYTGTGFDGGYKDVRIYTRTLSQAEAEDYYQDKSIGSTGLALHYDFSDQIMDGTADDLSGNGNNGLLEGAVSSQSEIVKSNYELNTSNELQSDARYQIRLGEKGPDGKISKYTFADYGNEGNVYFEDDFESGDLSAWDAVESGVEASSGTDNEPATGGEADEGTYYAAFKTNGNGAEKNIDLSDVDPDSEVIVKLAFSTYHGEESDNFAVTASGNGQTEPLSNLGWEQNRQGWIEWQAIIPESTHESSTTLRFERVGGFGCSMDRVVVSDILHEYTTPAAPTGLSLDTSVEGEITATWTDNAAFEDQYIRRIARTGQSWYDFMGLGSPNQTSYTETGLDDGEQYDIQVYSRVYQYRNGVQGPSNYYQSYSNTATATTILPPVTNAQVESIDGDSYILSWDSTTNNGTFEILISATGGSSFVTDGNTYSSGDRSGSTTDYNSDNTHIMKVRLTTGHKSDETAQTDEYILAGSVNRTDAAGVVEDEQPGVIMTDK